MDREDLGVLLESARGNKQMRKALMGLIEIVDDLSQALKPFCHPDLRRMVGGNTEGDDSPVYQKNKALLTIGDFKRANAAREKAL